MAGIRQFNIYVAADLEGRGSKVMTTIRPEEEGIDDVRGLQPNIAMYLWASYIDADGQESKPSPVRKTILANKFPTELHPTEIKRHRRAAEVKPKQLMQK